MPRYYCDYCNTYLTHDSIIVSRQHNSGYRHKANVRNYYEQFEQQHTQSMIDQRIKEHLSGQEGAFQIGAAYAAWRPSVRPPVLPAPLPIPGFAPPPVLPRPAGIPVYATAPITTPEPAPPGVPVAPVQANGAPANPPALTPTTSIPGSMPPVTNDAPPTVPQSGIQSVPAVSVGVTSMPTTPLSFLPAVGNSSYPPTSDADRYTQDPSSNN